ncbi:MAG: hypothetical protein H5T63_03500 [Chloroflexi bacterium]|nr:hypothetical protein [Chloroflexota bacterium]
MERCKEESASLRVKLANLQEIQTRLNDANAEIAALKAQLAQATARLTVRTAAAIEPSQADDLPHIEGIGPKISALEYI